MNMPNPVDWQLTGKIKIVKSDSGKLYCGYASALKILHEEIRLTAYGPAICKQTGIVFDVSQPQFESRWT